METVMNSKDFTAGLAELRVLRDEVKRVERELAKLTGARDKKLRDLAGYEKVTAERLAPAAGLSIADVVALVPALAPESEALVGGPAPQSAPEQALPAQPVGAAAPPLRPAVPAVDGGQEPPGSAPAGTAAVEPVAAPLEQVPPPAVDGQEAAAAAAPAPQRTSARTPPSAVPPMC
jgi:hypothetical protein